MTLQTIREAILAKFPVGSEWYDCDHDELVTILFHYPPRGLVARWHTGDVVRYAHGQLITDQLIPLVRNGGNEFQARIEENKRIDVEFEALLESHGLKIEWQT